jgi:FkbM family methyltransferase
MTKLTQINGKEIELNIVSDHAKWHFETWENYSSFILDEWKGQPYKDYLSKEDKVILDIGANVGLFALHVLPYAERIVCVEPTESHNKVFEELFANYIKVGKDYDNVYLEKSALHNYTGTVGWHIEPVNTTMNRVNVSGIGIEASCITLYDLCKKYNLTNVDFCKIDIEGSEDLAITVETVRPVNHIIKKFSIELHPRTKEMQDKYKAIFEESGYKTEAIDFNGTLFCYK